MGLLPLVASSTKIALTRVHSLFVCLSLSLTGLVGRVLWFSDAVNRTQSNRQQSADGVLIGCAHKAVTTTAEEKSRADQRREKAA